MATAPLLAQPEGMPAGMSPMYDPASLPDRIAFGPAVPPQPPSELEEQVKRAAKAYDADAELPCLMWDSVPDDPDNADYAAMQALMYDECTAAERAENFKVRGDVGVRVRGASKSVSPTHLKRSSPHQGGGAAQSLCVSSQARGSRTATRHVGRGAGDSQSSWA
jgi:hypothetical protein